MCTACILDIVITRSKERSIREVFGAFCEWRSIGTSLSVPDIATVANYSPKLVRDGRTVLNTFPQDVFATLVLRMDCNPKCNPSVAVSGALTTLTRIQ